MPGLVTIEIKDQIANIKLNRPEKYNALSFEMFRAIVEAGKKVAADPSIRVVVLSGAGKGFCAGLDLQSFMEMGGDALENVMQLFKRDPNSPANYVQQTGTIWKQVPVPVIAVVHGVAYGGGLQLALAADIRLAATDARLSVMEIKWGLIPDMSGTQTLRDLVRLDVAKELTFTGRIVGAQEAAALGLVTRVCEDPFGEAQTLAQEIVAKSPDAVCAGKRLFEEAWHGAGEKGLRLEETLQRTVIGKENQIEAVTANFEGRRPSFKDRRE
jgi:enoyl-CoA hydratase/carnithine racemase